MKNKTTSVLAMILLTLGSVLGAAPQANAMDTFDVGVGMFWETCLSSNVPGTFQFQIKKNGTSSWTTIDSTKAWDDRNTEDGSCPTYAVGVFWTPNKTGVFQVRLYNTSNKKSYKAQTIAITGSSYSQPSVQTVNMPRLVGALDGTAKQWLFSNGYKFSFDVKSTGFNPKLSCMMSGRNVILSQQPAAGTVVANAFSTRVTVTVNCEW